MADQTVNRRGPQPSTDVKKLQDTIEQMDGLAQEGFSEISAIAKLALKSLELPDGHLHIDTLADALSAIFGKAATIENCINATAEDVGCNYIDRAQHRRWAAADEARRHRQEVQHG